MLEIALRRRDPARNMARFYAVSVTPSLFGEVCLVSHWGRIGCRGRYRVDFHGTRDEAIEAAARLVGRKIRKGYR